MNEKDFMKVQTLSAVQSAAYILKSLCYVRENEVTEIISALAKLEIKLQEGIGDLDE